MMMMMMVVIWNVSVSYHGKFLEDNKVANLGHSNFFERITRYQLGIIVPSWGVIKLKQREECLSTI